MTSTTSTANPTHPPRRAASAPALKIVTVGALSLLLLIPAAMVWLLVAERQERERSVGIEIAQAWGGSQRITGPFLIVPYLAETPVREAGSSLVRTVRKHAVFLPDTLNIEGQAMTQNRSRGIFDFTVYEADILLEGRFALPAQSAITSEEAEFLWSQATLSLGLPALHAVRNNVVLDIQGRERSFEPRILPLGDPSAPERSGPTMHGLLPDTTGIHVPNLFQDTPTGFAFSIALQLGGSQSLSLTAGARNTKASIQSNWLHPSFFGSALPENPQIDDSTGFSAQWDIPYLSRAVPLAFTLEGNTLLRKLDDEAFGVRFFQPVDHYAAVNRALKYAILFIGTVFLTVLVIELRTGKHVHAVQYLFVGIALVLFYVLLLSLSEHIGFKAAYLIAASATALLIGTYCARSLQSSAYGTLIFALLGGVFSMLYLFMRLEEFALLAGSIFAFAVLAITMFGTLKVNWSGTANPPNPQQAAA